MAENRNKKKGSTAIFAVLRISAVCICSVLTASFIFTMFCGIFNPGNIVGTLICVFVILLVLYYPKFRQRKIPRILARAAGVLILCFAVYCGVISGLMISGMTNTPAYAVTVSTAGTAPTHTVIVLGCKTINGAPSPMLALRLNKAIEYLNAHGDAVCVLSGGQGGNEVEPEAASMKRYMLSCGIDEDILYTEERSTDTTGNITFSRDLIEENGLPREVVIISESYHVYRAQRQARLAGLNAYAVYAAPGDMLPTLPTYWFREIMAITRDYLVSIF